MQLLLFCRLEEEKNAAAAVLKDESEQLRSEVDKRSRESENIATVLAEKTVIIKVIHRTQSFNTQDTKSHYQGNIQDKKL